MKTTPYQFFLKHAGWSYDPKTETSQQGRTRCARMLAKAEAEARDTQFTFEWSVDESCDSSEFSDEKPTWSLWVCGCYNERHELVESLSGIDFGRDVEPWGQPYKRVVEAELALEASVTA